MQYLSNIPEVSLDELIDKDVYTYSDIISLNLKEKDYINEQKNINALSVYWLFLFIVWLTFFGLMIFFNDSVIAWCKALIS